MQTGAGFELHHHQANQITIRRVVVLVVHLTIRWCQNRYSNLGYSHENGTHKDARKSSFSFSPCFKPSCGSPRKEPSIRSHSKRIPSHRMDRSWKEPITIRNLLTKVSPVGLDFSLTGLLVYRLKLRLPLPVSYLSPSRWPSSHQPPHMHPNQSA